ASKSTSSGGDGGGGMRPPYRGGHVPATGRRRRVVRPSPDAASRGRRMTAEGPAIEGTGLLPPAARRLLPTILPAIVGGIGSALSLLVVSAIASWLEGILWEGIPSGIGIDVGGPLWILLMLTLVGLAIGLIVTFVPGHAGPDPATVELAGSPLPFAVLPGLALALVVMLAGGVSLGPENPIIGINVGLAVALGARLLSRIGAGAWAAFAFAGTIG